MKKILLFFLLLFGALQLYSSEPLLISNKYPVSLNNRSVFKIIKDDNSTYKNIDYDDSSWDSITLPHKSEGYNFTRNEDQIYWYRLTVQFPENIPEKSIGVSLGKISDIDETYFNGVLIGSSGSFQKNEHACNKYRIYEIPSNLIRLGEKNVIAIKVKNTYRADEMPGRGDYSIDYYSSLLKSFFIRGFSQLAFSVIYIIIAFLFLLIYFKRKKGSSSLFFSIFLLVLSIYTFSRLDIKYVFIDNFSVLQKIEFSSLYILLPFFMAFILKYFNEKNRLIHYIFYGLTAAFTLEAVIVSDHILRYKINVYFVQFTWLIPLSTWIYILAKRFKTNKEARLMGLSTIFILLGIIHDMLLSRGVQIFPSVSIWLSPFAFFLFVVSMAAIITGRHASALRKIEDLNKNLEQKVKDRTFELNKALESIKEKDNQIEMELKLAGNVQRTLLPVKIPEWNNYKLNTIYNPLREVSGDFYNFINFKDGAKGILIADACGHGMPAAIYTILAQSALSEAEYLAENPAELFKRTNDILCRLQNDQFFTAFFLKLTPERKLIYSNAGHTKAILVQTEKKKIVLLDTPGTFVGALADASSTYQSKEVQLSKNDKIILYTDCLVESTNTKTEEFGMERIIGTIKENFDKDISTMTENLKQSMLLFTDEEPLKDDLTIIGVEID